MNRDQYGIIGQIKSEHHDIWPGGVEGGDSIAFHGHWLYGNDGKDFKGKVVKNASDYIDFFEVGFGAYVRHPKKGRTKNGFGAHYKNPWDGCISRDQMTGMLCALISGREYLAMVRVLLHHACRGFFLAYNTIENGDDPNRDGYWKFPDITGPDILATILRGFGPVSWLFWPVLCVLDFHTLVNAVVHNYQEDDDVISFAGKFLVSREYIPTPTSLLAEKVLDKSKLEKKLKSYWCGKRDNCEIANVTIKKVYSNADL